MLDFFSGTIYIHFQKAGSSRNNYCIGLSFELIVRRVAARVYTLLSFLFWGSAGCGAPCGRRRLSRVQSYTPSPAPCKTRHSLTLPPKKGFAVVRLCGLSPFTGAPPPYPRCGGRLAPPLTVLSHRFLFFYFTHPYLREQVLHFCRKAKNFTVAQQRFTQLCCTSLGRSPPPPYPRCGGRLAPPLTGAQLLFTSFHKGTVTL